MLYQLLIDPLLNGLRKEIKNCVPQGSSLLDIACGTGALVFEMKDKCSWARGIDLNQEKIDSAQAKVERIGLDHLGFQVNDATDLRAFNEEVISSTVLSMALHQFSPELRPLIIEEALRISEQLIIADYVHPMSNTLGGKLAKTMEWLAGKEHNQNYLHYQANGGISGSVNHDNFKLERKFKSSVFEIQIISQK